MNIWLVTMGEVLATDTKSKKHRTAVLADKLVERGHSVLFFVSAFDHLKKAWIYNEDTRVKINERYELFAIKGAGYKKNISLKRFIDHRIIARKFSELAKQFPEPDIIISSMPPHDLAYQVVMFARKNSVPVLVDIRDPWPDIFLQKIPKLFSGMFRKIFFIDFYFIKKTMQLADGLLATTSTLLGWGLNYAKREKTPRDKVIYLAQKKVEPADAIMISHKHLESAKGIEDKFVVIFIGTFAHYHNPLLLIEAAKKLRENKNIHFVIAGSGQLEPELKKQSAGLTNVTFTGWLTETEINFWLSRAKVGVCPTPVPIDILPNKAGTYLSANLPVISSFQGDLKTMIEKEYIGFYYPPNDVKAFVECVEMISNDETLYRQMSGNARKVFEKLFDAEIIYSDYASHIENVVAAFKRK